jgi:hypothetical protein
MKKMMSRKLLVFLLIAIISMSAFCSNAFASNFEYWNTNSVAWNFWKDFTGKLEEEFRFRTNGEGFYRWHNDIGLHYDGLTKYLDFGFHYRFVLQEHDNKNWLGENRFYLTAKVKADLAGFKVSNRSQFEYRDRIRQKDKWLYRNKTVLKTPFKFTKLDVSPYMAQEFYVDLQRGDVRRNRIWGGIGFTIYKALKGDIYYLWQVDKQSNRHWEPTNIFGTKLKLAF